LPLASDKDIENNWLSEERVWMWSVCVHYAWCEHVENVHNVVVCSTNKKSLNREKGTLLSLHDGVWHRSTGRDWYTRSTVRNAQLREIQVKTQQDESTKSNTLRSPGVWHANSLVRSLCYTGYK